jgi:Zn finger protein HypA/HybF involved in hydrogenase expression
LARLDGTTSKGRAVTEKTGEIVREASLYRCENCNTHIRLVMGEIFPKCPTCGQETFDISNARFEKKDGSLGPHEPEQDGT